MVLNSPHPERILPLDHPDRMRVQKDEALNILMQQIFEKGPEHRFRKGDEWTTLVQQHLRIGRVLNALVDAIGWAAVTVPGLYLPNEE